MPDKAFSSNPHRSYCNKPCEAGEPWNEEYGPSLAAKSLEAVRAAK